MGTNRPVFGFRFEPTLSRGCVVIPKGFPRPVGAVVNRSLVFHRFHQCRHFRELRKLARTPLVLGIVTPNAAVDSYKPAPGTHRYDREHLPDLDTRFRKPPLA